MKTKIWIVSLLIVFTLVLQACNMPVGGKTEKNPTDEPTKIAQTEVSTLMLGERFRSEAGGFSIQKVNAYNFEEVIGMVNMVAPDADPSGGPGIMVIGALNPSETTNEQLLEKTKASAAGFTFSSAQPVDVFGKSGLAVDVDGESGGVPVKGRIVVVMVTPLQQFSMVGISPSTRWGELEPIFENVLASVAFFDPDPNAAPMGSGEQPTMQASGGEQPKPTVSSSGGSQLTRQWASSAKASSQYGNEVWSAMQATGAPNVEICGDNSDAWASQNNNTVEWIELTYDQPVVPTEINIYQSFNPSQVVEVQITDTNGQAYIAWSGEPELVSNCPDLMTITLELTKQIMVNRIRIKIDQRVLGLGWDEIDAVELVGYTGK